MGALCIGIWCQRWSANGGVNPMILMQLWWRGQALPSRLCSRRVHCMCMCALCVCRLTLGSPFAAKPYCKLLCLPAAICWLNQQHCLAKTVMTHLLLLAAMQARECCPWPMQAQTPTDHSGYHTLTDPDNHRRHHAPVCIVCRCAVHCLHISKGRPYPQQACSSPWTQAC